MTTETPLPATAPAAAPKKKPGIVAYISFFLACAFFSGTLITDQWWGIFDYTVLLGDFGSLVSKVTNNGGEIVTQMANFRGKGGSGAIDGFMFALSLVPTIMFALAMITMLEHYGALKAARQLLTPVLKPLLGLPGSSALALIASLQSTDGGAALTRQLCDAGELTDREKNVFAAFQMTADAPITNFFSSGAIFFTLVAASGEPVMPVSLGVCLGVILLGKIFAANVMRLIEIRGSRA